MTPPILYLKYLKKYLFPGIILLYLSVGCTSQNEQAEVKEKPNILLIVSEDNGQDLGCYGVQDVTTPNLDRLAENGIRFSNAYTTYSVCSPSRSTIFTGLYPHQNGQMGLATHKFRMYKSFQTIPVYLRQAGYRTGCLGKIHVNPEEAIPFDFHEIRESNFARKNLRQYASESARFINASEKPFFLMVNYPDAHYPLLRQVEGMPANPITGEDVSGTLPFVGADTKRLREVTADYYNSINRLDEAVGMLLDSLQASGKAENTLIIYLSDHGSQFSRGKGTNYEAALKIPLILCLPGMIRQGLVVNDALVSTLDLLPTLLEATGQPRPEELPGASLLSFTNDQSPDGWRQYLYADGLGSTSLYFFPRRSVRSARYKLVHNMRASEEDPMYTIYTDHKYPSVISGTTREEINQLDASLQAVYERWRKPPYFELYDLQKDPWEYNNLASDLVYQDKLEEMKTVLLEWQHATKDPLADPVKLALFEAEVDSVNRYFPAYGYTKDPDFQWRYPLYFYEND